MHPKTFLLATTAAILISASAASAKSISTQEFVNKVSMSDQFEIATSKLALEKSGNADVKEFAGMMVKDHQKTTAGLKAALKKSEFKQSPASGLDSAHQKKYDELAKLSGKEFDEKYASLQDDAHEDAVKLFTNYAENGEDPALKQFAANTLPALKTHHDHAEKLEESVD